MRVVAVDPDSPLFGHVRTGYHLTAINGQPVRDWLDYQYLLADERVDLCFNNPTNGEDLSFRIDDPMIAKLGLTLAEDKVRTCRCNCVFCFVRQQPKRMRRALYVRDEDYRLSFTHGNFITLSNVTEEDIERIIEQRLSPLYVSVHATDDTLRRRMLRNERLQPIVPQLEHMGQRGIRFHTQIVVCPGLNDGDQLKRTVDDLAALYPAVQSIAVVPVGLTRYREKLPRLRRHTAEELAATIEYVETRQKVLLRDLGTRLVWAADEFYIGSGRALPSLSSYEDMAQFENGVGMMRQAVVDFNRRRVRLKGMRSKRRVVLLTGRLAESVLKEPVREYARSCGLRVDVAGVDNEFWGESVTVSGLLTGGDLLTAARKIQKYCDCVVLPPNCLNTDDLFLDDVSLAEFCARVSVPVVVGSYQLADSIREALTV
jgi:putative radical SAM enzyme (TIGR03279 family)